MLVTTYRIENQRTVSLCSECADDEIAPMDGGDYPAPVRIIEPLHVGACDCCGQSADA